MSRAGDKPRPVASTGGPGRFQNKCEMKSILLMDPWVRELVMLSALAALGCGLAASQGDLLFVAIFGAACAVDNYRSNTTFAVRSSGARSPRALRELCL